MAGDWGLCVWPCDSVAGSHAGGDGEAGALVPDTGLRKLERSEQRSMERDVGWETAL